MENIILKMNTDENETCELWTQKKNFMGNNNGNFQFSLWNEKKNRRAIPIELADDTSDDGENYFK